MKDFYLYILQVNIGLAVFYGLYQLLFARDTFLGIRRLFLWTAFVLAFVYPAVTLPEVGDSPLQAVMADYAGWVLTVGATLPVEEGVALGWQDWLAMAWVAGVMVMAVRFGVRFARLCGMAYRGRRREWRGVRVIVTEEETAPFSFFGWIFVNPSSFDEKVLEEIMAHEQAHVRQRHSADMLAGELLCILFWFNPAVWLLRKALRQNLEFLADREVVAGGCNRKNYQYHLLRLSCPAATLQIVNNFNVSLLKKRIVMMNKKRTSRIGLLKYALLLPVAGLLVLSVNANTVAEMAGTTASRLVSGEEKGEVKGWVVDENGKPLQGVAVVVMNTSVGTVTDAGGCFTMPIDKPGTLCFTFVGRETKNVAFKPGDTGLKVVMPLANVVQQQEEAPTEVFMLVEEMPEFPGGNLQKYIAQTVRYPEEAMKAGEQGTVYVSFVIDKTGKVVQPKVVRGVSEKLDAEAIRVISGMPDWKPAKQRGEVVNINFTLPVAFKLTDENTEDKHE